MRCFIFEFITGGGSEESPSGSLLTEGLAMATALIDDFSRVPNTTVVTTIDARLMQDSSAAALQATSRRPNVTCLPLDQAVYRDTLAQQFAESDRALVVAPEFGGILSGITRLATESGTRLLSPSLECVNTFGSKQRTCDWLLLHQIPTPQGTTVAWRDQGSSKGPFPRIIKPDDGAGSIGVQRIAGESEWEGRNFDPENFGLGPALRVEEYVPGVPASVAFLCGGASMHPQLLAPCRQFIDLDSFSYLGGEVLADGNLRDRALTLAARVAQCLVGDWPTERGYFGVDLVLGMPPDGSEDLVIEVNPRITTSYVGLRGATDANLAEYLIGSAGEVDLRFPRRPLEFRSDGTILASKNRTRPLCDG